MASDATEDSFVTRKDPALLSTLLKMLPPTSKVKDYLKYSIPKSTSTSPLRPISAHAALPIRHRSHQAVNKSEKIQLDVLHPDFRLRRRSRSIDRSCLTLNTATVQSNLDPIRSASANNRLIVPHTRFYSQNEMTEDEDVFRQDSVLSSNDSSYQSKLSHVAFFCRRSRGTFFDLLIALEVSTNKKTSLEDNHGLIGKSTDV